MNKLLKNRNLVLLVLMLLILAACKKDDDGDSKMNPLFGVWTFSSYKVDVTVNGIDEQHFLIDSMGFSQNEAEEYIQWSNEIWDETFTGTIEFKSNGTFIGTSDGDSDNGTWEISSDNKKLTMEPGTVDEAEWDVQTLTSSKLVISDTWTEEYDYDYDWVDEDIVKTDILLTLTK